MTRIQTLAIVAALGGAMIACGDDDPASPTPGANTVTMGQANFSPLTLTIDQNESVTWSNTSGVVHNVTFSTNGAPTNIPDHSTGSNARTFPNTGSFAYSCTNHEGMNGTIVVQ